jgi:tetratricopeptide (TPR) repeat protein
MTAGSDKPSLDDRVQGLQYSKEDAGVLPIQRLAAALHERYTIERLIGRGGAAYVYLARDLRDDRLVALKLLRPDFPSAVAEARFHREIEIARRLQHPNILPLLDFGTVEGMIYFTMPFIEGDTLRARLRRERQLPLADALSITGDIANAMDYAHQNGVLHRDIKPPNILLDKEHVLVADFGVARAMIVASGEEITTHSGLAIGTPEYMSPEQGSGERELDARCDIYALGCVLYEMLAGDPPFTGPSAQAVIARHCMQQVQSIRVIRPEIPMGVERAISKALAKVPADRFSTGAQFVDALREGLTVETPALLAGVSRRARIVGAAIVAALIVAGALVYTLRPAGPTMDPNRVVVFPLYDQTGGVGGDGAGEAVATYVGYALDGTRPLKWMDGWELLDEGQRARTARLDSRQARKLSATAGAGFFIDGSIVRRPDSITVILRLFSLADDSVIRVAGRSAPVTSASPPQLGVAAVAELLPALVAPGGRVDLSTLSDRKPTAVANFLQGEREYRRMQFEPALQHYQSALTEDPGFTLAATRGAYAANWLSEPDIATPLVETGVRNSSSLSPAQALLTKGLRAYLNGSADSAVRYIRQAVVADSMTPGGWTLLGEAYSRLLPNVAAADSLARDALDRARRADSDFAPTLLLLEENALRDGNIKDALLLRDALRRAGADTTHEASRRMMLRCVQDGPSAVDWTTALKQDGMAVLTSGKILAARAAQPGCAIAIFRTIVQSDSVTVNARWAAFVGLQAQLAAVQRSPEAAREFARAQVAELPLRLAYLLIASAGGGFDREAAAAADSAAASYDRASVPVLWHLATWEAHRKNVARVRKISEILQRKADSSGSRRDRLMRDAIGARLKLLEGDSVTALRMFRSLTPSAPRQELAWNPWESLGAERMQLAELLFARGNLAESYGVATQLDATEPLTYPLYQRSSLILRLKIAEATKDAKLTATYHRRIADLDWSG